MTEMEEKERYSFEYADNGFDINDDELVYIFDNKNNKDIVICAYMDYKQGKDLCDLLNQQDARIKELEATNKVLSNELTKNSILKQDCIKTCCGIPIYEIPKLKEENQQLKDQLSIKMEELHIAYCGIEDVKTKNGNLKAEIQQLKQSQKQLAINELQKLSKHFIYSGDEMVSDYDLDCDPSELKEEIEQRIKSLKGEE